ncbi:hypothetical protein FGO68_gene3976 [Halteria grandinella]|uniref:Uncharacterized protein n=1 Tax=Halteria grandinella TaxID=5974 RepID=A0A8J8NAU2_HALGN|nr:hypothetical protein FGO68_gene3976 [Halteria grandinella]
MTKLQRVMIMTLIFNLQVKIMKESKYPQNIFITHINEQIFYINQGKKIFIKNNSSSSSNYIIFIFMVLNYF